MKNLSIQERTIIGSKMAKVRWSKTSVEQRLVHSKKMTDALIKKKKAERKAYEKEMMD